MSRIEKQLARAVQKGRSSQEDAEATRGRIQTTTSYQDLGECDLVIEAITESGIGFYDYSGDAPAPNPGL